MDEYDDSFQTGSVDLFEFASDEESPITRLKTLILSIDWEITDDILRQFNIELLDLKDVWAGDKIKLVYIQALEKLSRYIYKEKVNSNPNAIKLLLYFYSNLEKIVSTESMPEEEKKRLLVEDLEMFEKFKRQISRSQEKVELDKRAAEAPFVTAPAFRPDEPPSAVADKENLLLNLKAIIFGIDWEINEAYLVDLGEEIRNLEKKFSKSRAKLIFLQGIGALGAYINLKRSNAHVDAFKLLHSFFLSLEDIVNQGLSGEEEKRILMKEVEKFNAFKMIIASTISPEAIAAEGVPKDEDSSSGHPSSRDVISPAFADMPDDIHGFQEEQEAESLGHDAKMKVDGQIERFFDSGKILEDEDTGEFRMGMMERGKRDLIDEMELRLDGFFGEDSTLQQIEATNEEVALKGVNVETEADDDASEEALPRYGDELAPALSENYEESSFAEQTGAGASLEVESPVDLDLQHTVSIMEGPPDSQEGVWGALQGVEVETEADDDSEEEPLPFKDEELAPALSALNDVPECAPEKGLLQEEVSLGIEGRLEEFFGDDAEQNKGVDAQIVVQGDDIGYVDERSEEILALEEDLDPAFLSAEEIEVEGESVITPAVAREERELGMLDFPAASLAEDARQPESLSATEEDFFITRDVDQDPHGQEIPAEFEDHLKEFFETGIEEFEIKEEPEVDFSEVETEADAVPESTFSCSDKGLEVDAVVDGEEKEEGDFFASDEPAESEEDLLVVVEPGADAVAGMEVQEKAPEEDLFAFEEPGESEEDLLVVVEPRADAVAGMEEQEKEPEEDLFAFDEPADSEEDLLAVVEPGADAVAVMEEQEEEPEEDLFAFKKPGVSVLAAVTDEPSETLPGLQNDGDFIEYIEGVEFDSEEESLETVFEPAGEMEEVVFEAVDEVSLSGRENDDQVVFDGIEEDFDTYFFGQDSDKPGEQADESDKPEETFGAPGIFGERFEEDQELMGSEIRMEVFPETHKSEEIHIADAFRIQPAGDESLSGGIEPEGGEGFYVGSGLSFPQDNDPLSPLRNCIASLGLEINDSILESLFDEINKLNDLWISRPVEKIFLQLLSTVARHIDDYRQEASPEAHSLLMSIFNKLELSGLPGVEIMEVQEDLLSETAKILLWQQKMLARKANAQTDESHSVFADSGEEREIREREPALFFEQEREESLASQKSGENDGYEREPAVTTRSSHDAFDEEKISRIVRDELESLRQSLRVEMAELLRQHLDRNPSETNNQ